MNKERIFTLISKHKLVVGIVCSIIVIAIMVIVWFIKEQQNSIHFELQDTVIEYGEDVNTVDWIRKASTNATGVTTELDTKTLGDVEAEFHACIDDRCTNVIQTITIKDTKAPEIKLKEKEVELELAEEFDVASIIESVKDPIDGDIKFSEQQVEKDGYYFVSDVDTTNVGEYKVTIIAIDKNGNKAEKECKVIVNVKKIEEKPKETTPTPEQNTPEPIDEGNGDGGNGNASTEIPDTPAPQPPTPPTPEPVEPTVLCPNGVDPSKACDTLISGTGGPGNSGVWVASEQEALNAANALSGQWEGHSFSIGVSEWNDGRRMYTVNFQ